jgi:hypothetical protein
MKRESQGATVRTAKTRKRDFGDGRRWLDNESEMTWLLPRERICLMYVFCLQTDRVVFAYFITNSLFENS